jgi:hypothetical protein
MFVPLPSDLNNAGWIIQVDTTVHRGIPRIAVTQTRDTRAPEATMVRTYVICHIKRWNKVTIRALFVIAYILQNLILAYAVEC